jgi:hypothetical protein
VVDGRAAAVRGMWPCFPTRDDTTPTSTRRSVLGARRRRPRGVDGWSTARKWLRRLVFVVRTRLINLLFEEQDPKSTRATQKPRMKNMSSSPTNLPASTSDDGNAPPASVPSQLET